MQREVEANQAPAKSVTQQIQEHLAQGKSSQEIIALGFAPGSVYKAQRQCRKGNGKGQDDHAPAKPPTIVPDAQSLAGMGQLDNEPTEVGCS